MPPGQQRHQAPNRLKPKHEAAGPVQKAEKRQNKPVHPTGQRSYKPVKPADKYARPVKHRDVVPPGQRKRQAPDQLSEPKHEAAGPIVKQEGVRPAGTPDSPVEPLKKHVVQPKKAGLQPDTLTNVDHVAGANLHRLDLTDYRPPVHGESGLPKQPGSTTQAAEPAAGESTKAPSLLPMPKGSEAALGSENGSLEAGGSLALKSLLHLAGAALDRTRGMISLAVERITDLMSGVRTASKLVERGPPGGALPPLPEPQLPGNNALSGASSSGGNSGWLLAMLLFALIAAARGREVWSLFKSVKPELVPQLVSERPG